MLVYHFALTKLYLVCAVDVISPFYVLNIKPREENNLVCIRLLKDSFEEMAAFQRALKSLVAAANSDYAKKQGDFFVGLEGSFGQQHVTPRTLTSNQLGNIVCLEGIVTKCKSYSACLPKTYCNSSF